MPAAAVAMAVRDSVVFLFPTKSCATVCTFAFCDLAFALLLLLARPPLSIGVFNQLEMRSIMDWMLDTYYRHYKLYQYAFTSRWEHHQHQA